MEKYGTIPPRFTKEWWAYFWEYYKWHTIATAFVVILIAVTLVQCVTKTVYDMTVTYAGDRVFSEEAVNSINEALAGVINDMDGDGENNIFFQQLTFGTANNDPQYEMAMQTKLMLEFSAGETFMYIFSKSEMDTYLNQENCEDLFLPVSEWVEDGSILEEASLGLSGGVAYAVSLGESAYFKSLGLDMQDQYVVLRQIRASEEKDEKFSIQFENAKIAGNYLLAR